MRNNRRTWKRSTALLMTLAMVLSLPTGITTPRQAQAADYGLNNPTTDSNGVTTWDCVYFGNYWQNHTNDDGVVDENDAKQPIKWRVLSVDGDDAFLLADQNLDAGRYNESYTKVTWETCTMRSWLNGYGASSNVDGIDYSSDNFIDTAFTSAEQNAIRQVTVVNEDNPYYGTEGGNDTNDKVYLLSIAEASNESYGFNSTFDAFSDTRMATNTAYVAGKSYMLSDVGVADYWWLRSPDGPGYYASNVTNYGDGYDAYYDVHDGSIAVRPALHLNLSSSNLWTYAGTVASGEGGGSVYGLSNPTMDSNGTTTWDCIYFGNYWQNDTNGDGVADKNDEKQPIKWRVLSVSGADAFLLADQNLDAGPSNESDGKYTWETSTRRSWLNGYGASSNKGNIDYSSDNFIDIAFTSEEQSAIKQTEVENHGDYDTNDMIYLLSIEEASNATYGFNSTFDMHSKTRVATNTAYTAEKSGMCGVGKADDWWLRSPGGSNYDVSYVINSGYGDCYYCFGSYDNVAVRPVLHLDLSHSNLWNHAGTVSAEDRNRSIITPIPTGSVGEKPGSTQKYGLSNPTVKAGVSTWDCVYFGNYWQNDTNGDGVADKNDEKQPVKWRVLSVDGDDAFLLADQNLDAKEYDEDSSRSRTWETCTLRSWLNGYKANFDGPATDYSSDNFINAAFTSKEQSAIKQTTVVNEENPYYHTDGGNDTKDQIYLLSIAEASNASYGFNSTFDTGSGTRESLNTDYAKDHHAYTNEGTGIWWLRSPGAHYPGDTSANYGAAMVASGGFGSYDDYSGDIYDGYWHVEDILVTVRPVLHLDLSSDLWSHAGTVSAEVKSNPAASPTPTVSPSMTPAPTPGAGQDTQGTATPSTPPSNTKATLSPATVGTTIKDKTASYKVVSADKKQPAVAYTKAIKKNASSVIVPDKIKVNGVTYQVKSIAPKAFANNKKLKKITIGKNITSIGKQAFAGCKKLKKITIKSAKLKSSSIGKNAFKGTAKKLTVKVPKKQYKAYKKFLKKKGNKTVKVTK